MDDAERMEALLRELDGISPARRAFDRWLLRKVAATSEAVLHHWLMIANLLFGLLIAGALAVPAMRAAGWVSLPDLLFSAYHWLCEQRPERSYFLWGYQMAMDQRMTAIYGSALLAGLAFIPLPVVEWCSPQH